MAISTQIQLVHQLSKNNEFHSISKYTPQSIFTLYFKKSTNWLDNLRNFGGNHGSLYRTISRMPNSVQWDREEKCAKDLIEGKIKGFYIISDSLRKVIICNFNLEVDGILVPVCEYLTLDFYPALPGQEMYGYYSYLCDETESTPEFMTFFENFTFNAQSIIKNSYENPTQEADHHLVKTINFIKESLNFPNETFRIGQFNCNIYAIYKRDNHICWIFLDFLECYNIADEVYVQVQWFNHEISEPFYKENQTMFETYFEKSKNSMEIL
jgi:hypothetical protein